MDKQEVRVGWKVTADNMRSCVTVPRGSRSVKYKKGEWVQPNERCGPLCVFDSLQAALLFAECDEMIWRCFYVPSRQDSVWFFKASTSPNLLCSRLKNLPKGTVLADAVYLIFIDEVIDG